MLVIDACHSGAVISDPVPGLLRQGLQARVEFFAATRPEEVASRGCFSRSLIELLKKGSPRTADAELRAYDEHDRLREVAPAGCADLAPATHLSLNGSRDAGLWLGRNGAADLRPALAGTQVADVVARLTRDWQKRQGPAADIMRLLADGTSPIAITGGPGTGKSALLASFGRPSAGEYLGLDALVAARPGDNLADLAGALLEQLGKSPAYRAAAGRFQAATPVLEQETQPRFDQVITGPLAHLDPDQPVLVGVDAVDQLDTVQRRRLLDAFTNLPGAALIVTGRRVDDLPATSRVHLPDRDPQGVARLLRTLVQDPAARDRIASLSEGEWLRARLLSGLHRAGHLDGAPAHPSPDLTPVFQKALSAAVTAAPQAPVEDVARVLAAAPVGAWMPLQVVVAALRPEDRDGETLAVRVRDGVVALGELLARADAGSPDERVGPAHDLIADFLRGHFGEDAVTGAHSAIVQALAELEQGGPPSSVAAYARDRLSEHLWAMGRSEAALSALPELPTPADNLALWQSWHGKLLQRLGPDHPDTLTTRGNVAGWTGRAGTPAAHWSCPPRCCPTGSGPRPRPPRHPGHPPQHRLLDRAGRGRPRRTGAVRRAAARPAAGPRPRPPRHPDHPPNIASGPGRPGTPAAHGLFTALLPDQQRVLGPDHPDTLTTRGNIAAWTGQAGNTRGARSCSPRCSPTSSGSRPRPPRHPEHPPQHRPLDRAGRDARAALECSPRCCPTSSGSSAPTTPTP